MAAPKAPRPSSRANGRRRAPLRPTEGDVNASPNRRAWRAELSPETRALLDEDERVFLRQSLSTPCLDVLASCEGDTLTDVDGRTFLDFHGNSVHQVGFANPDVLAAVADQLRTLSFCPRRFTNVPAIDLARRLGELAPLNAAEPGKALFAPGGTLAVGMALKLARVATGRFRTLSMWDAFHGASLDALSVGGEAFFRAGLGPLLPGAEHVPPADPEHCLWNPDGDCARCDLRCAKYVDYVLEKQGDVACLVAEPLRCTTVNVPPPGYWAAVRAACDRHGALLIFDETALCLGRTGRLFACEHFEARPDMLVLGKGLGGGVLPLAALVARADLDCAGHTALGHYTHEKSPLACAAGLATLRHIETHDLTGRSARLGARALKRLRGMLGRPPLARAARGLGLALALELARTDGTPAADEADRVLYRCLREGLSFKVSDGNVLTLTPPLTIAERELDRALEILERALAREAA